MVFRNQIPLICKMVAASIGCFLRICMHTNIVIVYVVFKDENANTAVSIYADCQLYSR